MNHSILPWIDAYNKNYSRFKKFVVTKNSNPLIGKGTFVDAFFCSNFPIKASEELDESWMKVLEWKFAEKDQIKKVKKVWRVEAKVTRLKV